MAKECLAIHSSTLRIMLAVVSERRSGKRKRRWWVSHIEREREREREEEAPIDRSDHAMGVVSIT